jgi:chorismate mutase
MALLRERMGLVKKVGAVKHAQAPGQCPLRAGREAQQVRRVVEQFKGSDIYPPAAAAIWRNLIMASLRLEGPITVCICAHERWPHLQWLARDYFGAYTAVTTQASPKRVIGELMDGRAQIGVLPVWPAVDEAMRWWPELATNGVEAGKNDRPKIFAHLPFVYPQKPGRDTPSALAVGMLMPEESGDDFSLMMLESEEMTSTQKLQAALTQCGLEAQWLEVVLAGARRRHLVQVKGFVTPEHAQWQEFLKLTGNAVLASNWLGAYAAPLVLGDE